VAPNSVTYVSIPASSCSSAAVCQAEAYTGEQEWPAGAATRERDMEVESIGVVRSPVREAVDEDWVWVGRKPGGWE